MEISKLVLSDNCFFVRYFLSGLSDRTLRKMAERLGGDWEKLATFLGFTAAEIFCIKMDSPYQTENQIFNMLIKWTQRQPMIDGQNHTLAKELWEIGRLDIVHQLHLLPGKL